MEFKLSISMLFIKRGECNKYCCVNTVCSSIYVCFSQPYLRKLSIYIHILSKDCIAKITSITTRVLTTCIADTARYLLQNAFYHKQFRCTNKSRVVMTRHCSTTLIFATLINQLAPFLGHFLISVIL